MSPSAPAQTSAPASQSQPARTPRVIVRPAPPMVLPGVYQPEDKLEQYVDCNSPAHWDGETLYMFFSAGHPYRSRGPDLARLGRSEKTQYDNQVNGGRWIEATRKDPAGRLYGWYHQEPHPVCERQEWTAPLIGAALSEDDGLHWHDLGVVLVAPPDSMNCQSVNKYFTGGNGDFCVIPDRAGEFLYFFISTYDRDVAEQGVALARMRYADRGAPVGKVWKWHRGRWGEPGLGGHVTPIFPVKTDWHRPDVDAFWGPSVHWNTHLRQYVMLLNRARDKDWAQEGIYVSFNPEVADPAGWAPPVKILETSDLEGSKWYPQVIGTDAARRETDKLAGRTARLFVAGRSRWEISFLRPGEPAASSAPR